MNRLVDYCLVHNMISHWGGYLLIRIIQ